MASLFGSMHSQPRQREAFLVGDSSWLTPELPAHIANSRTQGRLGFWLGASDSWPGGRRHLGAAKGTFVSRNQWTCLAKGRGQQIVRVVIAVSNIVLGWWENVCGNQVSSVLYRVVICSVNLVLRTLFQLSLIGLMFNFCRCYPFWKFILSEEKKNLVKLWANPAFLLSWKW